MAIVLAYIHRYSSSVRFSERNFIWLARVHAGIYARGWSELTENFFLDNFSVLGYSGETYLQVPLGIIQKQIQSIPYPQGIFEYVRRGQDVLHCGITWEWLSFEAGHLKEAGQWLDTHY